MVIRPCLRITNKRNEIEDSIFAQQNSPMNITRELFEQQRHPRFGKSNPERMHVAFWEWMIRGDKTLPVDRAGKLAEIGLVMRDGKLKSAYGPYRARDLFRIPMSREDGPIWTFDRMGATKNQLPDGRLVFIGGEHEDFYDPDFCIYNDVIVFRPDQEIEIYGYPKEIFPPTDFHTATLVGGRIVIVGGLGYKNERVFGYTPTYDLDLSKLQISKLETKGEMPGWIFGHQADLNATGNAITIRAGETIQELNGKQLYSKNFEEFSLDLSLGVWRRLTNNSRLL
jgi:hypothetical protein